MPSKAPLFSSLHQTFFCPNYTSTCKITFVKLEDISRAFSDGNLTEMVVCDKICLPEGGCGSSLLHQIISSGSRFKLC